METLASPSFPKEWREGAIEYKQLKKLINGVVAELESLGLGADVLRDLIVPDGEQDLENEAKSESDEDEPLEKLQEEDEELEENSRRRRSLNIIDVYDRPSDTSMDRNANESSSSSHHHQHLQRGDSSSHDITVGSSADDCDECAKDLLHHTSKNRHTDSPAADWVAHIAHAKHSRGRRRSSRRERSPLSNVGSDKKCNESRFLDVKSSEYLRPSSAQSAALPTSFDGSAIHSDTYSGQGTSGDDSGHTDHRIPNRMGKKQLEEIRRRYSSVDGMHSYRASNVSSKSKDRVHDWGGHAWRERASMQNKPNDGMNAQKKTSGKGHVKRWVMGKDGRRARAEYELGGTSEKPIPRIRLYVESPIQSDDEVDDGGEADSEGESEDDAIESDKEDDARFTELGTSPRGSIGGSTIKPLQGHPRSPIIKPTNENGEKKRVRTREIVIPLNADTEFLDTLTGALSNLSSLQETQRREFQESTEALCSAVSKVASPYGNKNDLYAWREIFSLWCELQIFESQREKDRGELSVDETEARLKRFAEELAKRGWNTEAFAMEASQKELAGDTNLQKKKGKFAGKLTKWKGANNKSTAGALPMKDVRSISALEDFIKLNLALLDVKKFQRVNIEAARKILKKHDKRTALTASSDLGIFVEHEERMRKAAASAAAGVGISSLVNIPEQSVASNHAIVSSHGASTHPSLAALLPSSTSALMSASLPHILLSLMTTELLPILPSIDDYSCAICTGVAWRPIKLDCGHLFCIRCLVKLQKQGKNDCPMCRAPGAVGSADERNMDAEMVTYLRDWFPKEVDEKDKENENDRHKEEMLELGLALENEKCEIM